MSSKLFLGPVSFRGDNDATSATDENAAVSVVGGVSVTKSLHVGTTVNAPDIYQGGDRVATEATIPTAGAGLVQTGTVLSVDADQPGITSLGTVTVTGLTSSGVITVSDTTNSTSTTTGAVQVAGGIGVGGNIQVGGNVGSSTAPSTGAHLTNKTYVDALGYLTAGTGLTKTGSTLSVNASQPGITSLGTLTGLTSSGPVVVTDATGSIGPTSGALRVTGGLGIAENVFIGSTLNVANTATTGAGDIGTFYKAGLPSSGWTGIRVGVGAGTNNAAVYGFNYTGAGSAANSIDMGLTGAAKLRVHGSGDVLVQSTTDSTSMTTGALQVAGGVGIAKNLLVGGTSTFAAIGPATTDTYNLGWAGSGRWKDLWMSGQLNGGSIAISGSITAASNGTQGIGTWANAFGQVFGQYFNARQVGAGDRYVMALGGGHRAGLGLDASNNAVLGLYDPGTGTRKADSMIWYQDQTVGVLSTTNSTSATTGALQVAGGVGVGGNIQVGGNVGSSTAPSAGSHLTNKTYVDALGYLTAGTGLTKTGSTLSVNASQTQITAVGTLTGLTSSGVVNVTNTADSTSTTTGGLTVAGGMGIAKTLTASVVSSTEFARQYDARTIAPDAINFNRFRIGFGSFYNNGAAPYADQILLNTYGDASGGNVNLVCLAKDSIGMRIYQGTAGSATPFATFRDVVLFNNDSSLQTGDIRLGSTGTDHRYLRVGGGNSYGYLFGAFAALGDGVHLTYNAHHNNTAWTVNNSGGGTSRIRVGYNGVEFYTGAINAAPTVLQLTVGDGISTPKAVVSDTADSTSTTTGALTVAGGLGIAKTLNIGTGLNISSTIANPAVVYTGHYTGIASTLILRRQISNYADPLQGATLEFQSVYSSNGATYLGGRIRNYYDDIGGAGSGSGAFAFDIQRGGVYAQALNISSLGVVKVLTTTDSTSATTGGFQVAGGMGIAKTLNVAGQANVNSLGITNYTIGYRADSAEINWYEVGRFDGFAGARLKLRLVGGTGFNGNTSTGGEATIYASINNDGSGTTNANIGGSFYTSGGFGISAVKFVQAANRQSYRVLCSFPWYSSHVQYADTNASFVQSFVATTDPGANSATVQAAVPVQMYNLGYVGIVDTSDSTSATTGALTVAGGVGIAKNLSVGGTTTLVGDLYSSSRLQTDSFIRTRRGVNQHYLWGYTTGDRGCLGIDANENPYLGLFDPSTGAFSTAMTWKHGGGSVVVHSTADSTSATTGALQVAGGAGIAKALSVGTTITTTNRATLGAVTITGGSGISGDTTFGAENPKLIIKTNNDNAAAAGRLWFQKSTTDGGFFLQHNATGSLNVYRSSGGTDTALFGWDLPFTTVYQTEESTSTTTGALRVAGGVGIAKSLYVGGALYAQAAQIRAYGASLSDTTDSTSTTSGALQVAGGVGIGKALQVGGGALYLVNGTSNLLLYSIAGAGAPTFTTRSAGTKVVLYPQIGAADVDYAIGLEANYMWNAVPRANSTFGFKWYAGTTQLMRLDGTGSLNVSIPTATGSGDIAGFLQPALATGGGYTALRVGTAGTAYNSLTVGFVNNAAGGTSNNGYFGLTNGPKLRVYGTGDTTIEGASESTSTATGALQVAGGVGIVKNLWVGGFTTTGYTEVQRPDADATFPHTWHYGLRTGGNMRWSMGTMNGAGSVSNFMLQRMADNGNALDNALIVKRSDAAVILNSVTESTSTTTGALQVAGGVGISKALVTGGAITSGGNIMLGPDSPLLLSSGGGGYVENKVLHAYWDGSKRVMDICVPGDYRGYGAANPTPRITMTANEMTVTYTAESTSSAGGALIVKGGVGITKNMWLGGTLNLTTTFTGDGRVNIMAGVGSMISFYYSGTKVGSITTDSVSTAYNTTSDYRIKENVVELTDAATRAKALKPYRFNFIGLERTVDGMLAHEVQEVVPEAVTGEKDAVDDDGNPLYQAVDYTKLVPLLAAALKEAIQRIEALESKPLQAASGSSDRASIEYLKKLYAEQQKAIEQLQKAN